MEAVKPDAASNGDRCQVRMVLGVVLLVSWRGRRWNMVVAWLGVAVLAIMPLINVLPCVACPLPDLKAR